jgi:hypothetical protein
MAYTLLVDEAPYQMFMYIEDDPRVWVVKDDCPCLFHLADSGGFTQWHYLASTGEITTQFEHESAPAVMGSYLLSSCFRQTEPGIISLDLEVNHVLADCTWFGLNFEPALFVLEFHREDYGASVPI